MAGVYIIFQYVDSLVNRTSPIYFPCYCFDLFLIMRLFLHVPRLLKKKIWMLKVRVLQLLYLVYLANSCCITAFSVSIKCNCLSAKLKKGARKPVIVRSRNHWRFFFFANICFCFILIKEEIAKRNPSTQTFLSLESQAKTSRQLLWHWSIVWGLFFNQGSMKTTKT